jgi:hypothetical protein
VLGGEKIGVGLCGEGRGWGRELGWDVEGGGSGGVVDSS